MRRSLRTALLAYGIAIVGSAVLVLLWLASPEGWGEHVPFSAFLLVVGGAAVVGGFRPGILAAVVGASSALYFGAPRYTWTLHHRSDWVLLGVFVVTAPLVAYGCARLTQSLAESHWANLEMQRLARDETERLEALVAERTLRVEVEDRARKEREALLESERAARKEAERASRVSDELLATVSHELRTPLNAIVGWAGLLQHTVPPEKLARGLDVIARNAATLNQLVCDLLDTSRALTGKLHLEMKPQSLPLLVEAALEGLRGAAEARRIELRTALAPAEVLGDAARLQQVIWNLVGNAIKFTPDGGRVDVSIAHDGEGCVRLRVRDTGEGIDPELLPFLFQRFRQGDATPARHHGGLGLGLSIVRHLVDLHGGTVAAASEGIGRGAELTVTLPLARVACSARVPPCACVPAGALDEVTVMVVDDDGDAREIAQRVLEEKGASVLAAASAGEALEMLEALDEPPPGVIVSDIGMPGMDGYELVQRVRTARRAEARRIPMIALTAYSRPQDRARSLAAGFQDHVTKPFDAAALVIAVARACRPRAASTCAR